MIKNKPGKFKIKIIVIKGLLEVIVMKIFLMGHLKLILYIIFVNVLYLLLRNMSYDVIVYIVL